MMLALAGQVFDFCSKSAVSGCQVRVQSLPDIGDNRRIEFAIEQSPVGA
jgi:hypothetical protein